MIPSQPRHSPPWASGLTVGLLEPGAGTLTTELLGLAPPVVGDEECAVVLDEGLLELVLGVLVDELLVVGDDGLGDGLADGVDLRGVTTTGDADADVDIGWAVLVVCCGEAISHAPWVLECVPNLSRPRIRTGS